MTSRNGQEAREALERLAEATMLTAGRVFMDMGPAEGDKEGQQRARADILLVHKALDRRENRDDRAPRLPYAVQQFLEGVATWADRPMSRHEARRLLDRSAGWTNLQKAQHLIAEITELKAVQRALKDAFRGQDLEGGWSAALKHPLYVEAEEQIVQAEDQLRMLI